MKTKMCSTGVVKVLREGELPGNAVRQITLREIRKMPRHCRVVPMEILAKPEPIKKRKPPKRGRK